MDPKLGNLPNMNIVDDISKDVYDTWGTGKYNIRSLDWLGDSDHHSGIQGVANEVTAIADAIITMEGSMNPGDRGERHNNPGALATRSDALSGGYSPLLNQLWENHHMFPSIGDKFPNDPNYATLEFEHMHDVIIALRLVIGNILFRTIYNEDEPKDLKDFVSEYTGLPRTSKKVHNYANHILLNLSHLNDPYINSYYDPFNKVTQECQ